MSRSLIPMSLLAFALALPSSVHAQNDPDEGPIYCDFMASIGALAVLVGGGDASTSASSEEEFGCPKSRPQPVQPTQPEPTTPPPRQRPVGFQALN